jgi:hypothetical protein
MKLCPATGDDRFALFLFPFKLYVVLGLPFLWVCMVWEYFTDPGFARFEYAGAAQLLSIGYLQSLFVLLVGALLQALFSQRGRSGNTVLVFLIGIWMFWVLLR